jgi:copper(I)-binding protein
VDDVHPSLVQLVAFVELHVSVDEPPELIDAGLAVNVTVGAAAVTVTVAMSLSLPPGPVHVMPYVVVAPGETSSEPLVAVDDVHPSLVQLVVFDELQVSLDVAPGAMDVGFADSVMEGAAAVTVTVTVSVAVPPGPVHVMPYVVVAVGETPSDPLVAVDVVHPSLVQVVACVELHVSVEASPALIDVELAVRLTEGATAVTETVTLSASLPPGPVQVRP